MSDVLIKGMEMPKFCYDCPLHDSEYGDCNILDRQIYEYVPMDCHLIEVRPHGKLKDLNDILTIFDKVIHDVDDKTNALLCDLLVQIHYAPTVLEASE